MRRFLIYIFSLILFLGSAGAVWGRGVYVRSHGSYYGPYNRGYYGYRPYYRPYYQPYYPYYAPVYAPVVGSGCYGGGYYPYSGASVYIGAPYYGAGSWY